jgi:hypothetical protein
MIRTVITPENSTISLSIPEDYVGKQIEIIAFAKDEEISKHGNGAKQLSFTVLHVDNKGYKFNRDEANER